MPPAAPPPAPLLHPLLRQLVEIAHADALALLFELLHDASSGWLPAMAARAGGRLAEGGLLAPELQEPFASLIAAEAMGHILAALGAISADGKGRNDGVGAFLERQAGGAR